MPSERMHPQPVPPAGVDVRGEALDHARSWLAEELLHRAQGGKPRMVALTTDEIRALLATPPVSPTAASGSATAAREMGYMPK